MKITVLNGSPKGEEGVTLQYVRFLETQRKQHDFTYIHAAHDSLRMERDRS